MLIGLDQLLQLVGFIPAAGKLAQRYQKYREQKARGRYPYPPSSLGVRAPRNLEHLEERIDEMLLRSSIPTCYGEARLMVLTELYLEEGSVKDYGEGLVLASRYDPIAADEYLYFHDCESDERRAQIKARLLKSGRGREVRRLEKLIKDRRKAANPSAGAAAP